MQTLFQKKEIEKKESREAMKWTAFIEYETCFWY